MPAASPPAGKSKAPTDHFDGTARAQCKSREASGAAGCATCPPLKSQAFPRLSGTNASSRSAHPGRL